MLTLKPITTANEILYVLGKGGFVYRKLTGFVYFMEDTRLKFTEWNDMMAKVETSYATNVQKEAVFIRFLLTEQEITPQDPLFELIETSEETKMNPKFTLVRTVTTLAEIYKALAEGFIVLAYKAQEEPRFVEGCGFKLTEEGLVDAINNNHKGTSYQGSLFAGRNEPNSVIGVFKEVNWYANIPEQGVLCWVWDNEREVADKKEQRLHIVSGYDAEGGACRFKTMVGISWAFATPVTKEEILYKIL